MNVRVLVTILTLILALTAISVTNIGANEVHKDNDGWCIKGWLRSEPEHRPTRPYIASFIRKSTRLGRYYPS